MKNLEAKRELFIKKAKEKFGDKFDYTKVDTFTSSEKDKICIICPIHGEFYTTPRTFLNSKFGCKKCSLESLRKPKKINEVSISYEEIPSISNPLICSKDFYVGTVYCFINKVNNKKYIGETVRSNYSERFNEHRQKSSIENYPGCTYFYRAIRKYGWDSFERIILFQTEQVEATDENKAFLNDIVNEREIYFIEKYNTTNHKYGYNITEGGDGVVGYKFSEESKKKMSEAHSGKKHWNYGNFNNSTSCAVLQFDLDGKLLKEWPSMAEISRELGINANNVSRCCSNFSDSYKGYIWVKKSEYFEGYLQKYKSRAKCKSNDKEVLQYDFLGNFIQTYISCSEAGKSLNKGNVCSAANGRDLQMHGYIWIYKDDFTEELLQDKLEKVKNCRFYNKIIKSLINE